MSWERWRSRRSILVIAIRGLLMNDTIHMCGIARRGLFFFLLLFFFFLLFFAFLLFIPLCRFCVTVDSNVRVRYSLGHCLFNATIRLG